MRKTLVCGWVLALFAIVLTSTVVQPAAAEKDTLTIAIRDNTVSLDPAKLYESSAVGITDQIYERLVTFEQDDFTKPVPQLAESWDISEDGATWTFHLRPDVTFSTGNPLNAEAVVFSLRRALKFEGQASWMLTQFGITPDAISKIDDDTVQIVLDQQYAPGLFLSCLAFNVASILDPVALMEHEQNGDMGSAWLEDHSAGTGPFVLADRQRGEQYVLKANGDYWGEAPTLQEIIVKDVPEPIEQAILLEKEQIDVAWDLHADQISRLQSNFNLQVYSTPTLRLCYLQMVLGGDAPWNTPEVRDAIRYAIDYDAIIAFILGGGGEKLQTIIPKGLLGYNPATPYNYDIDRAKDLLAQAGYPDGFEVELACPNHPPLTEVALQLKRDLGNIGIDVTLLEKTEKEMFELTVSRQGELNLWNWQSDYMDPDANAKIFAHCDSLGDDATVQMMAWFSNYLNLETSRLVEEAARELDYEKRKSLYRQITDIILDDGPYAILFGYNKQYAIHLDARDHIGLPSVVQSGFPPIR
jgi:peptide/nickel transport system substrate-binding protein